MPLNGYKPVIKNKLQFAAAVHVIILVSPLPTPIQMMYLWLMIVIHIMLCFFKCILLSASLTIFFLSDTKFFLSMIDLNFPTIL